MKTLVLLLWSCCAIVAFGQERVVNIVVDCDKELGELNPMWAWFGYDEPNYTYLPDGKKLLDELAALSPVPVYVRTHNLDRKSVV